jgi:glycine/D-amino acid oxidase-like deaminating enzyme
MPEGGDGRRWELETPRGSVRCTHVVHATNAYAYALLPQLAGGTGIVPTRGQAIAIRAAVPARELAISGFTANYGLEYWIVRPGSAPEERPLVILGGARLTEGSTQGATTDDSIVDPVVGRRLREFLPEVFPGKFEKGTEPEMEWVRIEVPVSGVDRSFVYWSHRQASWAIPNLRIHLCVPV